MKNQLFKFILLHLLAIFSSTIFLTACGKNPSSSSKPALQTEVSTPTPQTQAAASLSHVSEASSAPAVEYVMEDLRGDVKLIPAGSTQTEPAEEDETVEAGDKIVTGKASQVSLTLNEMTMVHLSENSQLMVSELSSNDSNGFVNRLKLMTGRVVSEVQDLTESKSTFEVESGGVVCGVRGTAFEVQKQGEVVHTNTFHGAVQVQKDAQVQLVKAGEHTAFSFKQGSFLPKRPLNTAEKQRYQNLVPVFKQVQQKQIQRVVLLQKLKGNPALQAKLAQAPTRLEKARIQSQAFRQIVKTMPPAQRAQLKEAVAQRQKEAIQKTRQQALQRQQVQRLGQTQRILPNLKSQAVPAKTAPKALEQKPLIPNSNAGKPQALQREERIKKAAEITGRGPRKNQPKAQFNFPQKKQVPAGSQKRPVPNSNSLNRPLTNTSSRPNNGLGNQSKPNAQKPVFNQPARSAKPAPVFKNQMPAEGNPVKSQGIPGLNTKKNQAQQKSNKKTGKEEKKEDRKN